MKIFFFNTIFTYLKEILKCQGVIENKVFKKKKINIPSILKLLQIKKMHCYSGVFYRYLPELKINQKKSVSCFEN